MRSNTVTTATAKKYADLIVALPEEEFTMADAPDRLRTEFRQLRSDGCLEKLRKERRPARESGSAAVVWRVREKARRVAEHTVDNRDAICPCGHAGLDNRGSHYECGFAGCDRQFAREELDP